jgi:transposase
MRVLASSKPCPPRRPPLSNTEEGRGNDRDRADTHKRSHTIAAIAAGTGELLGEQTVQVGDRGFQALLRSARGLAGERVWALEDCRHVSGSLERFLIERGERVLRTQHTWPPRNESVLANAASQTPSTRSTSPAPRYKKGSTASRPRISMAQSSTCGCWSITASGWSGTESNSTARCFGTCTTCGPNSNSPAARCSQRNGRRASLADWLELRRRRGSGSPATYSRRLRELTQAINELERDITTLVKQTAPQLLAEPGFGPLTAAKLVGEIAGAQRFATPAKLARVAGVAPIPASSGNTQRHRLDPGGNRQINAALHRVIVTRARCHRRRIRVIASSTTV